MRGANRRLQKLIPGAQGQPHDVLADAGHFLQEDRSEELARRMVAWLQSSHAGQVPG